MNIKFMEQEMIFFMIIIMFGINLLKEILLFMKKQIQ